MEKEAQNYRDYSNNKGSNLEDDNQNDYGPVPMINWLKDDNDNN